jgi:hypothetical protein
LPISQTLPPQSRLSPARCRWIQPPFTQAALHRATEANQSGRAALLPGGAMARRADTNALRNGIGLKGPRLSTSSCIEFLNRSAPVNRRSFKACWNG